MKIDKSKVQDCLVPALTEALEGLIFEEIILSEISPDSPFDNYQPAMWAKISVKQPELGDFYLVINKDIMAEFTAAALGMFDEQPKEQEMLDSLGEIHNTACGRIMALNCGAKTIFNLTPPVINSDTDLLPSSNHVTICFNAGDNQIFLLLPDKFFNHINEL